MTRLTKEMKAEFVDDVLADTPNPNTEVKLNLEREMRRVAEKSLPPKVLAFWKDKELAPWLNYRSSSMTPADCWRNSAGDFPYPTDHVAHPEFAGDPAIIKLRAQWSKNIEARRELRNKLVGMIAGFSTLKAAHTGLPEFAKYLPSLEGKPAYAVAVCVANVVSELNAAGWPKEKKVKK